MAQNTQARRKFTPEQVEALKDLVEGLRLLKIDTLVAALGVEKKTIYNNINPLIEEESK